MIAATEGTSGVSDALRLRRLAPRDLARVEALHLELHRISPAPGLFVRETRAFFARHLAEDGAILGLETSRGELACYAVAGLPSAEDSGNFGRDIGLGAGELARVLHLDGIGVAPQWRGQGLQRRMIRERLRFGREAGRGIALSTAAPENTRSLSNLLAERFRVVALIDKYGALRFVLRHDAPAAAASAEPGPRRSVRVDAPAEAHRELLASGWEGTSLSDAGDGTPSLVYRYAGRRR